MKLKKYGGTLMVLGCSFALAACGNSNSGSLDSALATGAVNVNDMSGSDWTQLTHLMDCDALDIERGTNGNGTASRMLLSVLAQQNQAPGQGQTPGQSPNQSPKPGNGNGEPANGENGNGEPVNGENGNGEPVNGENGNGEPVNGENGNGEPVNGENGNGEPVNGDEGELGENGNGEEVEAPSRLCESGKVLFTLSSDGAFTISDGATGNLTEEELNSINEAMAGWTNEDLSGEFSCARNGSVRNDQMLFLTLANGNQVTLLADDGASGTQCGLGERDTARALHEAVVPLIERYAAGAPVADEQPENGEDAAEENGEEPAGDDAAEEGEGDETADETAV